MMPPSAVARALLAGAVAGLAAGPLAQRVPSAAGAAIIAGAIGLGAVLATRALAPRAGAALAALFLAVAAFDSREAVVVTLLAAALVALAPALASGLAVSAAAAVTAVSSAVAAATWPGAALLGFASAGAVLVARIALERPTRSERGFARFALGLAAGAIPIAWAAAIEPMAPFAPALAGATFAAFLVPFGLAAAVGARLPSRFAAPLALAAGASVALLFAPLVRASDPDRLASVFARLAVLPGAAGDAVAPFLAALFLLALPAGLLGASAAARGASPAGVAIGAFVSGLLFPLIGVPPGLVLALAAVPALAAAVALAESRKPRLAIALAAVAALALLMRLYPARVPPGVLRIGETVESTAAHAAIVARPDGARRLLVDGDEAARTDASDAVLEANVAEIALALADRPVRVAGLAGLGVGEAARALARRGAERVDLAKVPLSETIAGALPAASGEPEIIVVPPWRGRGLFALAGARRLDFTPLVARALDRAPAAAPRTLAIPLECVDASAHAALLDRLAAAGYRSLFIAHPQAMRPMAVVSTSPMPSLAKLRENLARLPGAKPPLFGDALDFLTLLVAELPPGAPPRDEPPLEFAAAANARRSETERALLAHRFLASRRVDPAATPVFAGASDEEKRAMSARFAATTKLLEAHEVRLAHADATRESARDEARERILAIELEALRLAPEFGLANDLLADAVPELLAEGEYEAASQLVAACIEASPRNWRHVFDRGLIAFRLLDPEGAAPDFRASTELAPDAAVAWAYLGVAHYQCRRPDEALAALERAVALDPDQKLAWKPLGDLYASRGDVARAIGALEKALAISPDDEECRRLLEQCRARREEKE